MCVCSLQTPPYFDGSGPNFVHVFFIPRKKYWCGFISKNHSRELKWLEERSVLAQNHAFSFTGAFTPGQGGIWPCTRKCCHLHTYRRIQAPSNTGSRAVSIPGNIFSSSWSKYWCGFISINQPRGPNWGEGTDLT
mgnify:CR=1 FL=1